MYRAVRVPQIMGSARLGFVQRKYERTKPPSERSEPPYRNEKREEIEKKKKKKRETMPVHDKHHHNFVSLRSNQNSLEKGATEETKKLQLVNHRDI
jgi:hypothetical protein